MPLISIPFGEVTVAASSIFLGVASSAIAGTLGLRVGLAIVLGTVIGSISYSLGVIPIGLYVAVGLVAVGAIYRRIFLGKSHNVATNQLIKKRKIHSNIFISLIAIFLIVAVFLVSFFNSDDSANPNNENQADYTPLPVGDTNNPYDLLWKTTSSKLMEANGYRFGTSGTQKNYSKAIELYNALIADGQSGKEVQDLAALRLAEMIYGGVGFEKSPEHSVEWYKYLIRRNAPYSLPAYRLGSIYENGEGVPQNVVYAYCYYNLSASSTKLDPMSEVPDYVRTGKGSFGIQLAHEASIDRRDQLEKLMTVEQVRMAQGLKQCGLSP